jgi:serine/threonine-protein kinase
MITGKSHRARIGRDHPTPHACRGEENEYPFAMSAEEMLELEIEPPHTEEPEPPIALEPEAELSWFTGALDAMDSQEPGVHRPGKPPPVPRPRPNHKTGRLMDLGELAKGGMASVRRAFDRNIRREVAIKRLGAPDPQVADAAEFLVEEAQITGQLEHPNIVPVYDLGAASDGAPMFVMRLVHGRTLTTVMRSYWKGGRNPIELREILEVLLKVCDAVSYAHSRGVVHRDLKPDNIMIGTHGQVYVMDWGCALLLAGSDAQLPEGVQSRRAAPNILLGTAQYMAPEQARGEIERVEPRSDVFGLGAVLYQLLTERPPHRGPNFVESVRIAQVGHVAPPTELRPELDLPGTLVDIAMRALAADPADRQPSVDDLKRELEHFVSGIDWFPRRRFADGESIVRQGEAAYTAYVIESGVCDVVRDVMGVRSTVRQISRGDVFGETAIFTDGVRSATVVAAGDVVAVEITRSAFEHRIGTESWLGNFMRTLAHRFRDAERRLDALGATSTFARVVEATLVHLHAAGVPGPPGRIQVPWSPLRDSLVHHLGVDETLVDEAIFGSSELQINLDLDIVSGPA